MEAIQRKQLCQLIGNMLLRETVVRCFMEKELPKWYRHKENANTYETIGGHCEKAVNLIY